MTIFFITLFLKVKLLLINKYTKLSAEPEGDIVTAFWETPFPHMQYEVAELLWGGDEEAEKFGATEIQDLSWKDIYDGDAFLALPLAREPRLEDDPRGIDDRVQEGQGKAPEWRQLAFGDAAHRERDAEDRAMEEGKRDKDCGGDEDERKTHLTELQAISAEQDG